ncbi:MAG TPA: DinB family protein [Candidatus Angelobacter sp.]|nr:DinB family protein [Candidatus Angelobacter sp.]
MNWTQLLKSEMETAYVTTAALLEKVNSANLAWKPQTGSNWMTVGQLLKHIGNGCGAGCKGFITGDWGLPPGKKFEDLPVEEMLPPAEALPSVETVEEARKLLAEDKAIALQMVEQAGENALANKEIAAPWSPGGVPVPLGRHLLQMIQHLERHKTQLFYYLKLQGEPVNTADLWGAP